MGEDYFLEQFGSVEILLHLKEGLRGSLGHEESYWPKSSEKGCLFTHQTNKVWTPAV